MGVRVLGIGVLGLSRGFDLTRPTLAADPRCRLVAAFDPRPDARAAFAAEFAAAAHESAEALCADPDVDVVYIASPHAFHADQAVLAAAHGKHVLVEKPMAVDLAGCDRMIAAARRHGVQLVVGPSHGFDPPVRLAADLIASGEVGRPRMASFLTYTDFLYRPRRPEELETASGGGVFFSQAPHQVDMARRLLGPDVRRVRATAGRWDLGRPTEGAYQALLEWADGASATLTYSGYGRYDSDALMDWVGETGAARDPGAYGAARRRLAGADEAALKAARAYGSGGAADPPLAGHEHFGFALVSCERADLRLTPHGVEVFADDGRRTIALPPPAVGRTAVVDVLWSAVVEGRPVRHSGAWGRATLAVCLAMLRAAACGDVIELEGGEEAAWAS
jgi:phthalate 4,5-cis-dihydrodiol dehydrogenase